MTDGTCQKYRFFRTVRWKEDRRPVGRCVIKRSATRCPARSLLPVARFASRQGGRPWFATLPQWPRINRSGAKAPTQGQCTNPSRTRHFGNRPVCRADSRPGARVTTPLRSLVTRAESRCASCPPGQRPVMQLVKGAHSTSFLSCQLRKKAHRCREIHIPRSRRRE